MERRIRRVAIVMTFIVATVIGALGYYRLVYSQHPQRRADRAGTEVAAIREKSFKSGVPASKQSREEYLRFVEGELDRGNVPASFGKVALALGYYSGPEIEDFRDVLKRIFVAGAGGYYDVYRRSFFIVRESPEPRRTLTYAHESYHALQDQHFDLQAYLHRPTRDGSLNGDEALARQAVVEGEATYVALMHSVFVSKGRIPNADTMKPVVQAQASVERADVRQGMQESKAVAILGKAAVEDLRQLEKVPPFLLESFAGVYRVGVTFVHAIHAAGGWAAVDKLYVEYPPVSTEQILHPEKWQMREAPVQIDWQALEQHPLFADWSVLDQNVIGEFSWRILFNQNGLAAEAEEAASGWGGDRYAVLEQEGTGELLVMICTTWDTEADARQFAAAYRRVVEHKRASRPLQSLMSEQGRDVTIVEGGDRTSLDQFLRFAQDAARNTRQARRDRG
jgi:hypothetical protein